ncbi:MAG: endonuclease domain-containing protein [Candidatus Dojkabacteria bacterium]
MYIYNKNILKQKRKYLRNNATEAEVILWSKLKNKQLASCKFIRQYSIDNYILDFYCPLKKLGIELDGSQHSEVDAQAYDNLRTIHLESYGIKILRFWNSDIKNNLNKVLTTIFRELE